ncbi:MAG: hypothetical protein K5923_03270 [Clostridia bacterium]|nr:hypothetical protein [Clostridia bacterium]
MFEELDAIKKDKYGEFDPKAIRVHRAISWGKVAEKAESIDEKFIFYWIALNAAYSDDSSSEEAERTKRKTFFEKISQLDTESKIKKALFNIPNQLRVFVDNQYLYTEYWKTQKGEMSSGDFEFVKNKMMKKIYGGLMAKDDDVELLDYLFTLMSLLRNQIFHGLATYNSSVNREQLKSGVTILEALIPILIEIVLENDDVDWGEVSYPYTGNK